MADGPKSQRKPSRQVIDGSVEALASKALSELASRAKRSKGLSQGYINKLTDCVLESNSDQRKDVIETMLSEGVPQEDLIDLYIPAVARILGERWCSDSLGFADVTIGTARLQAMVRDLSSKFEYPKKTDRSKSVVVVVMIHNYHTLGAMVLATQLRRVGISVRLLLDVSPAEALRKLRNDVYDAVMISASHSESLENLADLVKNIKQQTSGRIPVAIGGPVTDGRSNEIEAITGADIATSDVYEAIRACRLKTSRAEPIETPPGS